MNPPHTLAGPDLELLAQLLQARASDLQAWPAPEGLPPPIVSRIDPDFASLDASSDEDSDEDEDSCNDE